MGMGVANGVIGGASSGTTDSWSGPGRNPPQKLFQHVIILASNFNSATVKLQYKNAAGDWADAIADDEGNVVSVTANGVMKIMVGYEELRLAWSGGDPTAGTYQVF